MKNQIAIFRFTLGSGQSIGPADLKAMWMDACQASNVSVGRVEDTRGADKSVYSLYAPLDIATQPQVEQRLRDLLDQRRLRASLVSVF
ncbi:hypothetical protein [Pseudoxanthomonas suwonensis]|uniref:Uncharacterized protein n=1 Tax=Pseudoxanthomonas suwonensis TaxID=314722 RepID=A0A0E3YZV7_9GAMM|nr:hypothetical protein [Pseudoxanthomonas suwonensis]AKC85812.1 hypothetical protein WQ53_02580 [Pseudoxanthomonas suwonensis]